ncbi:hypothetical protein [Streptomyces sp. HF10]|uniref:hypothetical protein n=1 Tax=Streptomyces sp. HF10 TaxID=2692233 RepID=UPI0013167DF3|nr:hypothetical protein [Streptomyces sp. HF10]QHC33860.1 hypothetical protein GR129_34710 [Streptomyces sp. HF10]
MTSSLRDQTAALLDAAGRLEASVGAAGWSAAAADETLDAVDILLAALCRIGPEVGDALAPVQRFLADLQARLAAQEKARVERAAPRPGRRVPPGAQVPRPGDAPEDWIDRDAWHAEKVFMMLRRPGAQEEWMRLAAVFDALPVRQQQAATRRVAATGECWAVVLEGADSPRPELTAMRVSP